MNIIYLIPFRLGRFKMLANPKTFPTSHLAPIFALSGSLVPARANFLDVRIFPKQSRTRVSGERLKSCEYRPVSCAPKLFSISSIVAVPGDTLSSPNRESRAALCSVEMGQGFLDRVKALLFDAYAVHCVYGIWTTRDIDI